MHQLPGFPTGGEDQLIHNLWFEGFVQPLYLAAKMNIDTRIQVVVKNYGGLCYRIFYTICQIICGAIKVRMVGNQRQRINQIIYKNKI